MTERSVGPMLRLRGLVKRFGDKIALDHIDLEVEEGEIHVICGENGAGKSTLMNILAGIMRPDAGEIFLDGSAGRFADPIAASAAGDRDGASALQAGSLDDGRGESLSQSPASAIGICDRPRSDAETARRN